MFTYSNRLQPALQNLLQRELFGSSTRDRHAWLRIYRRTFRE